VSDRIHFNTISQGFVTHDSSAPIVFGWVFLNLKLLRLDSIFFSSCLFF
jgi:hypothetical protein